LWRNDGGSASGHWLSLHLRGRGTNPDAIGARAEVRAQGRTRFDEVRSGTGYLSQSDFRLHFGLGSAEEGEVRVRWPDGTLQQAGSLKANQFWLIEQGSPARPAPRPHAAAEKR
jgi:hypothetical protein